MSNVVDLKEYKMNKLSFKLTNFVDNIRQNTRDMYDMLAPLGFKTRRRTPIEKMDIWTLVVFADEMNEWARKNRPELTKFG